MNIEQLAKFTPIIREMRSTPERPPENYVWERYVWDNLRVTKVPKIAEGALEFVVEGATPRQAARMVGMQPKELLVLLEMGREGIGPWRPLFKFFLRATGEALQPAFRNIRDKAANGSSDDSLKLIGMHDREEVLDHPTVGPQAMLPGGQQTINVLIQKSFGEDHEPIPLAVPVAEPLPAKPTSLPSSSEPASSSEAHDPKE